jgi:hypothetical protein
MIATLLAISAGSMLVGVIGAARRENWGLFFLLPGLGAIALAPVAAVVVIATMAVTEIVAGHTIRAAYGAEPFWAASMIAGMVGGLIFAVIAVIASAKPAAS